MFRLLNILMMFAILGLGVAEASEVAAIKLGSGGVGDSTQGSLQSAHNSPQEIGHHEHSGGGSHQQDDSSDPHCSQCCHATSAFRESVTSNLFILDTERNVTPYYVANFLSRTKSPLHRPPIS